MRLPEKLTPLVQVRLSVLPLLCIVQHSESDHVFDNDSDIEKCVCLKGIFCHELERLGCNPLASLHWVAHSVVVKGWMKARYWHWKGNISSNHLSQYFVFFFSVIHFDETNYTREDISSLHSTCAEQSLRQFSVSIFSSCIPNSNRPKYKMFANLKVTRYDFHWATATPLLKATAHLCSFNSDPEKKQKNTGLNQGFPKLGLEHKMGLLLSYFGVIHDFCDVFMLSVSKDRMWIKHKCLAFFSIQTNSWGTQRAVKHLPDRWNMSDMHS